MKNSVNLKVANLLFQQKRYEDALSMYKTIVLNDPSLKPIVEFNIQVSKEKLSQNQIKSKKVDILATVWLSNDEPIHDILKNTLASLLDKSITCKLFAPSPLLEKVYDNFSHVDRQESSIYLSLPIIPSGSKLPASFLEKSQRLMKYFLERERKWIKTNRKEISTNSLKENTLKGIRYWTEVVLNHSPKLMLIWGSSSPVSALLIEICKLLRIKYQIIERGLLPGTLIIDDNEQFGYSFSNHLLSSTSTNNLGNSNLSSILLLNEYLKKTDAVAYKEYNNKMSNDIKWPNKSIILLIGSNDLGSGVSLKDSHSRSLNSSVYKSSWDVAADLARALPSISKDAVLYIKPHPADQANFHELESHNVKVFTKDNIHDLIEISSVCCTLCSTAIAICLLKQKPLVTFTTTDISNTGSAYEIYRKSELISQVRSAFLGINSWQMPLAANRYFEFALKYRLYFDDKFKKFGNTSVELCERLYKLVVKEFTKLPKHKKPRIDTIDSPKLIDLDKNLSLTPRPVDIVIPLYDGYKLSRTCIEYALNTLEHYEDVNIILINDCSPNDKLSEYLESLISSGIKKVKLHVNTINTGFSGAVNIGISHSRSNADILLLNSDALISNNTLRSLQITAYSNPKIGTVCPLSTDGGLMTLPIEIPDNTILRQDQLNQIDSILFNEKEIFSVILPVNHGACLYIKRSALEIIGSFDEFTFGRGYSEEIDFCLRLRSYGYMNMGCCFSFIQHVGGISFGKLTDPLKMKNRKIISEKYPFYFSEVQKIFSDIKFSTTFLRSQDLIREYLSTI